MLIPLVECLFHGDLRIRDGSPTCLPRGGIPGKCGCTLGGEVIDPENLFIIFIVQIQTSR